MEAGTGPGTTVMYMQRATSGAAGKGLCTTIKYLRGAAGIGLGTRMMYPQRTTSAAVNSGLGTTIKDLANQNADAGSNWTKAYVHKSWHEFICTPHVV
jgi:hypothetical protein